MSPPAVVSAARISPPILAADATGVTGVFRVACTGSAQNVAVPAGLRGKPLFITLRAVGVDVQFGYSLTGSAITVVLNQASTWGTGNAGAGATLPDDQSDSHQLPVGATHLCWISASASGFFEGYISESLR